MAKFCANCGEHAQENAKFCASCGQAIPQPPQYQQQYPSAPAPAKKSSKTPFIIAGAGGLAVIALAVTLIATGGFGLLGKTSGEIGDAHILSSGNNGRAAESSSGDDATTNGDNGPADNENSIDISVPKDASDEELVAYLFIENVISIFDMGHEYANDGLTLVAGLPYGTAAASVSAMRYAVDCLLEIKGAPPAEDGRLSDWDEIAALGWASPYPYFFEGIVINAKEGIEAATPCYEKACRNPAMTEDDAYLIYIISLDADQLQRLRTALTEAEDEIPD